MEYYNEALKRGKQCFRNKVSNNEDPYLPVLDDIISAGKADLGTDIGLLDVPSELIIGTKTKGRTNLFAENFMPLAKDSTEFAYKWQTLAQAHIEEGIRDPIIAWEYMNRYYVQEGNKRTSVLKFFNSPQIQARVKRILPTRTGDEKVELYYELLDFKKYSRINRIEFSKVGSYKELLKLLGKKSNETWTEEETKKFNSTFYFFEKAFFLYSKESQRINVSDAFLLYIKFYGYETLKKQNEVEISKNLIRIHKEVLLLEENLSIEIKMNPSEKEVNRNIFSELFYVKKKVAFIFRDDIETSGWRKNHENGRLHVESALRDKVTTKAFICKDKTCEETIKIAIQWGASIIFATGSTMWDDCLKLAIEYPKVKFYNCGINKSSKFVSSYYPRMYEGKFISGAIAGAMTKTGKIGYICKYPIYGMIAEINAFSRGVRTVNPNARVQVYWSSVEGIERAEKKCLSNNCDLISYRDYGNYDEVEKRMIGLKYVENGVNDFIAVPIWNWGIFYEKMLRSIIVGTADEDESKTKKAINYYWGISAGVVDFLYAERLPYSVRYLGEVLFKSMEKGICDPFYYPNQNQNGTFQWNVSGLQYSAEQIIQMEHFEENIDGEIPEFDQVVDTVAKEVIKNIGVQRAKEKG